MSSSTNIHKKALVDQSKVEKNISTRMTKNKINKFLFLACTLIGLLFFSSITY